jgi:hypothetical protein
MTAFTVDSARHEEIRSPARKPFAIVDQATGVGGDVDRLRGAGKLAQIGVVHLQPVHVIQEETDCLSSSVLIAVAEQPFDPLQFGQQALARRLIMVSDTTCVLTQHRQAHGDMEPCVDIG